MVWPFSAKAAAAPVDDVDYEYETDSQGSIEIEEYVDDSEVEYELGGEKEVKYETDDDDDDEGVMNRVAVAKEDSECHEADDEAEEADDEDDMEESSGMEGGKPEPSPEPSAVPEPRMEPAVNETPLEPVAALQTEPAEAKESDATTNEEMTAEETSLQEKQSLLALAAEHDRVDILKGILSEHKDRDTLLHSNIPPLHVAVAHGSTNATSCLLRMGANPSVRPQVVGEDKTWLKYDGLTAWELAFGREEPAADSNGSGWFGMGGNAKFKPVDMAPSKREGIRHAFTAEALRCIGADEGERLSQLLASGMPADIDIGGKNLHGWCIEMGAKSCQALVGSDEDARETLVPTSPTKRQTSFHGDDSDVTRLTNRLEEVEALASALSSCLDNLAEEVSVCHGLLLLGGGGSALASHVRSLKELLAKRQDELVTYSEKWKRAEEDVEILAEECGASDSMFQNLPTAFRRSSSRPFPTEPVQLKAQIGASENKVRKLRASIGDMSEENSTAIKEVERKGLSGGIKLVRGLREELREIEFQLSTAKTGEAACRAKIQVLQTTLHAKKKATAKLSAKSSPSAATGEEAEDPEEVPADLQMNSPLFCSDDADSDVSDPDQPKSSDIADGKSKAIMLHKKEGYMPLNIWFILLRIIGLGRVAVKANVANFKETATSSVMIV